MDTDLRDLERAVRDDPGDRSARVRLVVALVRLGCLEDAWRFARASDDAALTDALYEGAQAPFTLELVEWPHPTPVEVRRARFLGAPGGTPGRTVLGRHPDAELYVPSPWIARRHSMVTYTAGSRFLLQDLGSANGTWIRAQRIESAELVDGSRFSPASGDIVIELRLGWDQAPWPAPPGPLAERLLARLASDAPISPPHV